MRNYPHFCMNNRNQKPNSVPTISMNLSSCQRSSSVKEPKSRGEFIFNTQRNKSLSLTHSQELCCRNSFLSTLKPTTDKGNLEQNSHSCQASVDDLSSANSQCDQKRRTKMFYEYAKGNFATNSFTAFPTDSCNHRPKNSATNAANTANNSSHTGRGIVGRKQWPSIRGKLGRMGSVKLQTYQPVVSIDEPEPVIEVPLQLNSKKVLTRDVQLQFDEDIMIKENMTDEEYNKHSTTGYLKEQFFSFFQPADNKLAMKLFGNKNALNKEKRRQQQAGKWIIHPCSNFRFYWDLMMLILLIANLIILPVAISFFNDDLSLHWIVFNCASDTIFLLDIMVNFRSGIIADNFADEIILDPNQICKNYIHSWFFLDLISSIPMDYIFLIINRKDVYSQFVHAGRTLRILKLAKLLSILRLLRLSRLVRYVSQWEEFLNMANKFMGICKLVLMMLLLAHWNACLQYLIPVLNDFPADSWVTKCKLQHAYWFHQYTWALFKALSHMLSIGYGRFPPTSISEAWITVTSVLIGVTCYALFVGHAAALIQSFDTSKRLYREKFKQVEEYMAYRKLPRALRQRIDSYYEHRYQGKMFNEDLILSELSECLREQIINYNCRALVASVPFFTYADQDFVSEVVTKLKFEVFQPGDLIIKEGTVGTKMYFIQEGIVDIITKDGEVATSLSDGSYFGEICLLTNAKRVASVRAETYCNLYSLDSFHFLEVLENYPLMRRTMESVAAERLNKIGKNPELVTDRKDLKEDLDLVHEMVNSAEAAAKLEESEAEDNKLLSAYSNVKPRRKSTAIRLGLQLLKFHRSRSHTSLSNNDDSNKTATETNNQMSTDTPFILVTPAQSSSNNETSNES